MRREGWISVKYPDRTDGVDQNFLVQMQPDCDEVDSGNSCLIRCRFLDPYGDTVFFLPFPARYRLTIFFVIPTHSRRDQGQSRKLLPQSSAQEIDSIPITTRLTPRKQISYSGETRKARLDGGNQAERRVNNRSVSVSE